MVLIIDDNPDDIIQAKRSISTFRRDCAVEVALDGSQAMERLRNPGPPSL